MTNNRKHRAYHKFMAIPVKPTPVLSGKDSKRFNEELEKGQTNKVSGKDVAYLKDLVSSVLKNSRL